MIEGDKLLLPDWPTPATAAPEAPRKLCAEAGDTEPWWVCCNMWLALEYIDAIEVGEADMKDEAAIAEAWVP